jgi:hypothetical protein
MSTKDKSNSKKPKYTFTLIGVDISRINNTYGIENTAPDNLTDDKLFVNTTKLTELNTDKGTPEVISFLDESKKLHTCHLSMIDFHSRMEVNLLRYHCFWCKNPFDTRPIGCPIKYNTSQAEKKYHSHISRDTYTIKENITEKRRILLDKNDSLTLRVGEYYETDGVFCSFNCCQAWINDNKHNRLYDLSSTLLIKMYNSMMGTKMIVIGPAPHWRVLEQYGGHLNIIKFRDGFNKIDYECHGNTKPVPKFFPLGTLFEEKIKF